MENKEEIVSEEVKNSTNVEVSSQKEPKKDNNKALKIVVGILIILAVIGLAIYLLFIAFVGKIFNTATNILDSSLENNKEIFEDALNTDPNKVLEDLQNSVDSGNKTQNSGKIAISADKFNQIMISKSYQTLETTSQFIQYGDYIKKSYMAKNDNYKIEFYELSNEDNALDMYNTNKTKFESQKGNSSSYLTVNKNNYNTYTLNTNGKYKYLSRIDNTFIYVDVPAEYKDEVKDLIEELGY